MKNRSAASVLSVASCYSALHFLLRFGGLLICLLLIALSSRAQTTDTDYEDVSKEDEYKKVCWPVESTSKTDATTTKMQTSTSPSFAPSIGGLPPARNLFVAVEVGNTPFPNPATMEIYDLQGNTLIINGTQLSFTSSSVAAFKADSILGTTNGYHWVGYQSNAFQPDSAATYFFNTFHRWYSGMPGNYHNYSGRQWIGDNSGHSNYADTVYLPHPISVSIVHPVSCYGGNDGILHANVNPLNYYKFKIDTSTPTTNPTFTGVSAGSHTVTITDSFANHYDTVIVLAQPPSVGQSYTVTNCGLYTWPVSGVSYPTSGVYLYTSTSASGCPKTDTLNLTVTGSSNNTSTITAYNSYTWPVNGLTYTSSGSYFYNSVTSPGCQTFSILNLTVLYTPFNMNLIIDQPISCYGNNDGSCQATAFPTAASYIYVLDGGAQTNNSGFFMGLSTGTHTVCANQGSFTVCKTITFTDPDPLTATITIDSTVSCNGQDGGLSATISGGTNINQNYLTYWTNASNVLLNPPPNDFDTYITGLNPGLYHLTVEDDNGCTFTASKSIGLTAPLEVTATASPIKCYGGSTAIIPASTGGTPPVTYTMFGFPLFNAYPAGTYEITATDARGCTATTLIDFGQPAPLNSTVYATSCDSYYWSVNAATYTNTGTYNATLSTVSGCSISNVLHLTILHSTSQTQTITACDTYTWPVTGNTYTSSGTYTATGLNSSGCTLTSTLNLSIHHSTTSSSSITACNTYTWPVNGTTYTISGTYTATSMNSQGCIQTNTLLLTINHTTTTNTSISACNTFTWTANSITYTSSGTYTHTITNNQGCTQTDTLHLSIRHSSTSTQTTTASNTYTWPVNGSTYTLSGSYQATLSNTQGCDSIITLQLTINQVPVTISLRCFIQGYVIGFNEMEAVLANEGIGNSSSLCDTILVQLRRASSPYNILYSVKTTLNTSGFASCTFPPLSGTYYLAVQHRNTILTWSASPLVINTTSLTYLFNTSGAAAYGGNEIQLYPSMWAFFNADINQDENIDLLDALQLDQDINNFQFGYQLSDLNGDGNVDLLDLPVLEPNVNNFIYSVHP